ncbi:MAG: outer membrane beta-barrel protein [Muribaculaceae bacterium]|nr:outer membrane beta-barrel protein [Muribaculaceae bacterium]
MQLPYRNTILLILPLMSFLFPISEASCAEWRSTAYSSTRIVEPSLIPAIAAGIVRSTSAADTLSRTVQSPDTVRTDTLPDLTISVSKVSHDATTDSYLVTKEMRRNAHNAGDLLGKIPGIYYNPLTQGLAHLGSRNVMILVDSVEKDQDYIKRLNPDRFARISVTSFPTGKYADYDAVINLVTKKVYAGYDGSVFSEIALRPGGINGSGNTIHGLRENADATYTRDNWNFAVSSGYSSSRTGAGFWSETDYTLNDYSQKRELPPLKDPNCYWRKDQFGIRFWSDYRISDNHSLSAGISVRTDAIKESVNGEIQTVTGDNPAEVILQDEETRHRSYLSLLANLQYRGKIGSWSLSGSAQYTHTGFNRLQSLSRPDFQIEDNRQVRSDIFWGGASVTKRFAERKLSLTLSDYVTVVDYRERALATGNPLSSSRDTRNRFTASLQYTPVRNFSVGVNAGANVIRSVSDGEGITRVTPRLGVNAMWSHSKVTVRFNYRTVTGYPTLAQQQGYGTFTDSLVYRSGNPTLSPSRSNIVEGSVNLFGLLTVGGGYTHVKDAIFDIAGAAEGLRPDGLEGDYVYYQYKNARSRSWRANVTYTQTFRQKWTVSATVSAEGKKASYGGQSLSKVLPNYDWYVMYNNEKSALQLYLSSQMSPDFAVTPQQISWARVDMYSLAVVKFLFSYRLQLVAMWRLPFHIWDDPYRSRMISPALTVRSGYDTYDRYNNQLVFSVTWRFKGGNKTRKYNRSEESVDLF